MTKRYRRLRRIIVAAATILLLVAIIVPIVVKRQAIAWVGAHTKRTLQIESVRLNPLTLSVSLRGLHLSDPGGGPELLSFDRLKVALSLRSIYDRAPILRRIVLEGPRIHIVRTGANSYSFDDLLALGTPSAEPAKPAQEEKPTQFSLNNIEITGGHITFADQGVLPAKIHTISDLTLKIPFVGNVPYLTDVYVTPELRANVNGTPLLFEGKLKPFRDGSETVVEVNLVGLDLASYASYYPGQLPVTLRSGSLDTALNVIYRISSDRKPEIVLSGEAVLNGIDLTLPGGAPLFKLKELHASFDPSSLMNGELNLASLYLRAPQVDLHRDRQGRWQLPLDTATSAPSTEAPAENSPTQNRITLKRFGLSDGTVRFSDEQPQPDFATTLSRITVQMQNFDSGSDKPATFDVSLGSGFAESVNLSGQAALQPLAVTATLTLANVQLRNYYPYLQPYLTVAPEGIVGLTAHASYDQAGGAKLSDSRFELKQFNLRIDAQEKIALERLEIGGIAADPKANSFAIGEVVMAGGDLRLSRGVDGSWSPLGVLRAKPLQEQTEREITPPASTLYFDLGALDLQRFRIDFKDHIPADPATLRLRDLHLALRGLSLPANTIASAELGWQMGKRGSLQLSTAGRFSPLQLQGDLRLRQFPLPDLIPYLSDSYHLTLVDGTADARLRYQLQGNADTLGGNVSGSFGIRNLQALDSIDADELIRWESLQLDGIRAKLQPTDVKIDAISLSGLSTHVIIDNNGKLNFGKVVATPQQTPDAAEPAAPPPAENPAAAPKIAITAVTLQNGTIDFVDQQMSPRFQTTMTALGGRVSGLSSTAESMAELDLRGSLENRSPLRISGKLNPLAANPYADIKITFDDIELAPVTPYAGRYAGYTIDQGKLFLDLNYQLENQQIKSSNRIFVDQFTFGDKVDSPEATNLPVRLAVALLKDRKGEIHLDIPISGRSDDPEFQIASVVWKVLKNLIVKAATSPMALLSSMIGGEEFTAINFPAGRSELLPEESSKLKGLATILQDRPALKLSVSGYADSKIDPEGYRRAQLEAKISRAKYLELSKRDSLPTGTAAEQLPILPEERSLYLQAAYRKEKFPKPRNALGFTKDLPDAEVEKLILANVAVGTAELEQLAWERGSRVVRYLVEVSGLPQERIFQKRPDTSAGDKGTDWQGNRVEFGLTAD